MRYGVLALAALAVLLAGCGRETKAVNFDASPGCYDRDSRDGNVEAVHRASKPLEACERAWQRGTIVRGRTRSPAPLRLCVADSGTPLVFPSDDEDVCDKLDLAFPDKSETGS